MVLGLLDQLQIFWQLYLIELLGLLRFIFRAFIPNVWHGISGQILGIIFSFLGNRWLWVILDGKSSKESSVNAWVLQGPILGPTLFLLYINYLPDDVICNIGIYVNDATLYSKCDQVSDLWQQVKFGSELDSDLRDTVDWDRKWLVDFNAWKTQWVLFDWCNNVVLLIWKWMGLFLRKNHLWRRWGWLSLPNLILALRLSLFVKLLPRTLGPWFVLWRFFLGFHVSL